MGYDFKIECHMSLEDGTPRFDVTGNCESRDDAVRLHGILLHSGYRVSGWSIAKIDSRGDTHRLEAIADHELHPMPVEEKFVLHLETGCIDVGKYEWHDALEEAPLSNGTYFCAGICPNQRGGYHVLKLHLWWDKWRGWAAENMIVLRWKETVAVDG